MFKIPFDVKKSYRRAAMKMSGHKSDADYIASLVEKGRYKVALETINLIEDNFEKPYRDTFTIYASVSDALSEAYRNGDGGQKVFAPADPENFYALIKKSLDLSQKHLALENNIFHPALQDFLYGATRARDKKALEIVLSRPEASSVSLSNVVHSALYTLAENDPRITNIERRKFVYELGNGEPEMLEMLLNFIREHYEVSDHYQFIFNGDEQRSHKAGIDLA